MYLQVYITGFTNTIDEHELIDNYIPHDVYFNKLNTFTSS